MIDYRINVRGAAVVGNGSMMLRRYVRDVQDEVAEFAKTTVHANLKRSLQNPIGYYQSHVGIQRRGGMPVVDDDGVIYGPWLEGVGSRNAPVTRFKGYASFRRAGQATERKAPAIAERVWRRYAGRF